MENKKTILRTKPTIVKSDFDFFVQWLQIIRSFSPLTDKELSFVACLLAKRFEVSKVILDEELVARVLFSKETKEEIVEFLKLKDLQEFENKAHQLRKKEVIGENNMIDKRYIPNIPKDYKEFMLVFTIIKEEANE